MTNPGREGLLGSTSARSLVFYPLFALIVLAGIYTRLDQFLLQVLLDDEWHAVHQLLAKGPAELFTTIGRADFSIPLALLYWLELKFAGLSEFAMRWPMLLAGVFTLLLFPLYIRRFFGDRTCLLFSALLAISPVLLIYSRMARPYALTLLLSLLAITAFHKYVEADKRAWGYGLAYCVCAVLTGWLHMITLPLLIAPFLVLGFAALLKRDWRSLVRMLWLGILTLAGLLALLLPPLLNRPEALSVKLGVHSPGLETYYGVLFNWLGTSSAFVVLLGSLLAIAGAARVWRNLPISHSLLAGLGLTCVVVLLTNPAWVHHPGTFARYVLPALPLFLLAVASGMTVTAEFFEEHSQKVGKYALGLIVLILSVAMAVSSPLPKILQKPNSNSLHSVYRFDFREQSNLIRRYQRDFPVSDFWQRLALFPANTLKIAVAPFSFETNHWDAVRWEQISRQRVMPGYLLGLCANNRWGEVPRDGGYEFENAGYLADQDDLAGRGFALVVYQKPFSVMTYQGEKSFGADTADCEEVLRNEFPEPVFEDDLLVVYPLSESVRNHFEAVN